MNRLCALPACGLPIREGARRDARFHSKRCRQRFFSFARNVAALADAEHPLRLAFADPPYIGKAARIYKHHPDFRGEVDHGALLDELRTYDGWGLCCSGESLPEILRLCDRRALDVRVAPWFRGSRPGPSRRPLSAWEAVVYAGGRQVLRDCPPEDALVLTPRARLSDPNRVTGAKPPGFASWVFSLLDARRNDTLHDLFPGSGAVSWAWSIATGAEHPVEPAIYEDTLVTADGFGHPTGVVTVERCTGCRALPSQPHRETCPRLAFELSWSPS